MELLGDIWHVVQRGLFFNNERLSLLWGEVVKEESLARAHSDSLKEVCTVCL